MHFHEKLSEAEFPTFRAHFSRFTEGKRARVSQSSRRRLSAGRRPACAFAGAAHRRRSPRGLRSSCSPSSPSVFRRVASSCAAVQC